MSRGPASRPSRTACGIASRAPRSVSTVTVRCSEPRSQMMVRPAYPTPTIGAFMGVLVWMYSSGYEGRGACCSPPVHRKTRRIPAPEEEPTTPPANPYERIPRSVHFTKSLCLYAVSPYEFARVLSSGLVGYAKARVDRGHRRLSRAPDVCTDPANDSTPGLCATVGASFLFLTGGGIAGLRIGADPGSPSATTEEIRSVRPLHTRQS